MQLSFYISDFLVINLNGSKIPAKQTTFSSVRMTELQNRWGWEGPLEITESKTLLKQG